MSREAPIADATPRVVKAGSAGPLGTPITFNFGDLRRACDDHLSDVRSRSGRLISDAASEAERIRREAAESGRRDGRRDGLKAAEAETSARVEQLVSERVAVAFETLSPAIERLTDEIRLRRDEWSSRWETEGIRLAVAIAEKLLHRSLRADPASADRLIAEAVRLAAGSPRITVKLSPADYARLGGTVATLAETIGKLGTTDVVADPSITPGGCVVETEHGRIDGRLETQLERIASELSG